MDKHYLTPLFSPETVAVFAGPVDEPDAQTSQGRALTGPADYKKHFLGLSDNITFFVEQMEPVAASPYRYRVIFKPDVIVPDINLSTGIGK